MKKLITTLLLSFCLLGLLFLSSCKTEEEIVYDIRGTWNVFYYWFAASDTNPPSGPVQIIFTGSLTSGTFTIPSEGNSGTYTVTGMAVQWTFNGVATTYNGNFTSLTTMNGTMFMGSPSVSGTWYATKL